jgi:type IV secretory pathway ATPase VirB11/archaellum biosynthesis ATPase
MTEQSILSHRDVINACNQRGGRMLSLIDLLKAESVDLPLAAYLAAMMQQGNSLLVGAQPGGAGKTTVMAALLNFVPPNTKLQAVENMNTLRQAEKTPKDHQTCYIAHEISPATYYYAYLWGRAAQRFFALTTRGHLIAFNLHADTLEETRDQLIDENGVAPEHLDAVTLKVYLGTRRQSAWSMRRWVRRVYENDGSTDRLIWTAASPGCFVRRHESQLISEAIEAHYADLLERMQTEDVLRISEVRRALLKEAYPG